MPNEPDRELKPTPEAEAIFRRWLAHLNDELSRHPQVDRRSEIVRDELFQLFLGRPHGGKINASLTSELATSVLTESFDPRNVTLLPEYSSEIDPEQYGPRKPLLFFWQMFDSSPLGLNYWLGTRFRCTMGRHIFQQIGKGVKISSGVTFTYGYNLTIEDNCTIGQGVWIDDSQPLTITQGTTIAPFTTFNGQQTKGAAEESK